LAKRRTDISALPGTSYISQYPMFPASLAMIQATLETDDTSENCDTCNNPD
jgi:hypothetical protein